MKCIYRNLIEDLCVYIDSNGVVVNQGGIVSTLDISFKDRFNILISLFGLKEEWVHSKCTKPVYEIIFQDEKKEEFMFDVNVPSNFSLFLAYINKLVGDYYE